MKESCSTCSSCIKFSLWVTIPGIVLMAILFFSASQNVFGETGISIPNKASELNCAQSGNCFLPSDITIQLGETVTWSNDSSTLHTVTSGNSEDGPNEIFDSQLIMAGETFSHTFSDVGEFQYFCSIHPWMSGTVTVQ